MSTTSFVPRRTIHREGAFASSARALEAICVAASNSGRLEVQSLVAPEKTLFAFPASATDTTAPTVAVAVDGRLDSTRIESIRASITDGLSNETREPIVERLEREVTETTTVLALMEAVLDSPTVVDAARRLTMAFQSLAPNSRVFVGVCRKRQSTAEVLAASDTEKIDRRSPSVQAVERLMNQVLDERSMAVWDRAGESNAAATSEKWQAVVGSDGRSAIAFPLFASDGHPVGSLVVIASDLAENFDRLPEFLQAAAPSLAAALHSTTKRVNRRWFVQSNKSGSTRRRNWSVLGLIALFAVGMGLFIPVTHRIESTVRVEPEHRRYVSAPFDGILERALVKPGDVVVRGEVIAKIDGQNIAWKRAAVQAEQNQARKKRDAAQATRNYAEQQIAQLEIEQQDLELKLLDDRIRNLEIASPIDGIVTSGDLVRAEGAPIEIGQSLFEVAPLERLMAELEIHDRDIAYVLPGQTVDIRIDAYPGEKWNGTIQSIRPRAELRSNNNVFVAEVEMENGNRRLRPGMKGRASIAEQPRPYGWILLHEPIEYLVKSWWW